MPTFAHRTSAAAALACLALLSPGPGLAVPPSRVTLVTCAPGAPGTSEEAAPAMAALAAALTRGGAAAPGGLDAVYLPGEAEGVARLGQPDAVVALVTLPFFLAHGPALGLRARLHAVPVGGAALERWSLVARKGRVARPADLAAFSVQSTAGYAPSFVRGALGAWGRLPDTTTVASTTQVLSALRKVASGADVAVLLDGEQAGALASLPFAGDLEVVARSAPLPTSVVASVRERLPAAGWSALERAFLGLQAEPVGAAALAGVRLSRFVPVDEAALAAARALAAGGAR